MLSSLTAPLRAPLRLAGATTMTAARVVGGLTGLDQVASNVAAVGEAVAREIPAAVDAARDLGPGRHHRQVWSGHGRANIEVRGLEGSGPRHRRVAQAAKRRVNRLSGVRWAEINAVTGELLVSFDERRVEVGTLLNAVRAAEEAAGTRTQDLPWSRPIPPGHPAPIAAAALELTADCIAVMSGVVGRVIHVPAVPRGAQTLVALLEVERPLRRELKRRIGPLGTDATLALLGAVGQGLSQGPGMPAVDALYRLELLAEALSRRTVWQRREAELCSRAAPHSVEERPPRPAPRPKGPIETWNEQLSLGGLFSAATVLGLTGQAGRAADAVLVAVPRAARYGRGAFAATAARQLAKSGVVSLNAAAFRRFDRMSAVVLDSGVLCGSRAQILAVDATADADTRTVWQAAGRVLRDLSMDELLDSLPLRQDGLTLARPSRAGANGDPPGGAWLTLRRGNRRVGRVLVGREPEPLADALIEAAQSTGARVLLTEDVGLGDLLPRADDVIPAGEKVDDAVRRLQQEGHGVLVISASDDASLAAADVGVCVLLENGCESWSGDLLCGPDLVDTWRVLRVAADARPVSEAAVRLAKAGSALGTLLALVGGRGGGRSAALAPVYSAGFVALLRGTTVGLRATRQHPPTPVVHVPWHALDPPDVLSRLRQPATQQQQSLWVASVERARGVVSRWEGAPVLHRVVSPVRSTAWLARAFREELRDPLTPVLAVGAAASAIVGSGVDAVLVGSVMTGNALISAGQRVRAEGAIRQLLMAQEVVARRLSGDVDIGDSNQVGTQDGTQDGTENGAEDGAWKGLDAARLDRPFDKVPSAALAPGDVIALRASDVVPADVRLIAAVDLEVDESTLTGESAPVQKSVRATPGAPLAERTCMAFEGTTVLAGSAYAVVVATGDATEGGRATRAAGRSAPAAGIQARLGEVTRVALPVTGLGGLLVTGLGVLRGLPLRQAVAAGVSIAVAAVPEGLPLVATVAQASSARRLSRRGILVRSSRTLEALGRVDTICFDKTGTLTEGRLAVDRLAGAHEELDPAEASGQRLLLAAGRACPPAGADDVQRLPHATDRAIVETALQLDASLGGWRLDVEVPFESNRGYAASLGHDSDGTVLAVKGAPEVILPLCAEMNGRTQDAGNARAGAERMAEKLAADGLRVIAVAERRDVDVPRKTGGQHNGVESHVTDLSLVGFVGIADRPRAQAVHAVRSLAAEGVRVVMVTGDHPTTAAAIARSIGVPDGAVLTGPELERMTEDQRINRVPEATVFARVSPEQKVRIVEALRGAGRTVAMTGDGTNDAAAIRLADVGIGVGAKGSTSARSAADLVIAGTDITLIHDALLEGRALWRRVRDAVSILVGGNAGEVAFMVLGTALAGRAPINTRQLLLVNMLTDMFPALAVAVAERPADAADMGPADAPTDTEEDVEASAGVPSALGDALGRAVAVRGTATTCGAMAAWMIGRLSLAGRIPAVGPQRTSTMGLAALVATQLGQTLLLNRHSRLVAVTSLGSLAVLFLAVETPGVSQFFGCVPIGPVAWIEVFASAGFGTVVAAVLPRVMARATSGDESAQAAG